MDDVDRTILLGFQRNLLVDNLFILAHFHRLFEESDLII